MWRVRECQRGLQGSGSVTRTGPVRLLRERLPLPSRCAASFRPLTNPVWFVPSKATLPIGRRKGKEAGGSAEVEKRGYRPAKRIKRFASLLGQAWRQRHRESAFAHRAEACGLVPVASQARTWVRAWLLVLVLRDREVPRRKPRELSRAVRPGGREYFAPCARKTKLIAPGHQWPRRVGLAKGLPHFGAQQALLRFWELR